MKNIQRGFIGILALIIIALGIIGGGIYLYTQNNGDVRVDTTNSSTAIDDSKVSIDAKSEEIVSKPVTVPPKTQTQKIAANAVINSVMNSFRAEADLARTDERGFDREGGYKSLCKNGEINAEIVNPTSIKNLLSVQDAATQAEAKIKCVASKDSYAIEIIPNPAIVNRGVTSYCVSGTANSYETGSKIENLRIDASTYSCK